MIDGEEFGLDSIDGNTAKGSQDRLIPGCFLFLGLRQADRVAIAAKVHSAGAAA